MPGPPQEGQLLAAVYTLSKHASIKLSNTNDVILPHEENHGITLRCLKQDRHIYHANLAMQGTQTQGASHLLRHPAGTMYRICLVLAYEASMQDTIASGSVSLGSLWQPILKRSKRCMQRMERGKFRSDLAWRSAGLANQFLYVHRRESSVGQVLGQMSRLSQTVSLRCLRWEDKAWMST